MANFTPRFGFNYFGGGTPGTIMDNGQKFTALDPLTLDRLLAAIEVHDYHYAPSSASIPTTAPTALLATAGGQLTAGFTYYYRFSVIDSKGNESVASPQRSVPTPIPLSPPAMPSVTSDTGVAGTLTPGYYYYALTALRGAEESTIGEAVMISLIAGEGSVRVTLPDYGDADSFSVWRMGSTEPGYTRIGVTDQATFLDNGSTPADPCACDPGVAPPSFNTGISNYAVAVTVPAALDLSQARGWRLYRTTYSGLYEATSLVHEVVEREDEWDDTSPLLRTWTDAGGTLSPGKPMDVDMNMRAQPFVFDHADELPAVTGYPDYYPFIVDEELYLKLGATWVPVSSAGGGGGGMSSVLTSPDGSRFTLVVDNAGELSTAPTLFPGPPALPTNVTVS